MRPESVAESLLGAVPAAARRLDVRARNPPVRREVVSHAQGRIPFRLRQPERLSQPPRHSRHRAAHRREVRVRADPARRRVQADQQPLAGREPTPASGTSPSTSSSRPSASSSSTASRASGRNPFFPVNTLALMRGAVAARKLGVFERYVDEVFRHMWAEPKKMDDPAVLARGAGQESGFDGRRLFDAGAGPGGQGRAAGRHPARRSSAARSARRPSSSATRSTSARTACATSRRRSPAKK